MTPEQILQSVLERDGYIIIGTNNPKAIGTPTRTTIDTLWIAADVALHTLEEVTREFAQEWLQQRLPFSYWPNCYKYFYKVIAE